MGTETQLQLNGVSVTGGAKLATVNDAAGGIHQQTVLEYWDGSSDPVAVGPANPLPITISAGGVPSVTDNTAVIAGSVQGLGVFGVNGATNLTAGMAGLAGISIDRKLYVAPGAAPSGGATPTKVDSLTGANATVGVLKASPGQLYSFGGFNNGSTDCYVKLYDKASSPVVASDVPVLKFYLPSKGGNDPSLSAGLQFLNGIAWAITTNPGDTDNTNVVTGQAGFSVGIA